MSDLKKTDTDFLIHEVIIKVKINNQAQAHSTCEALSTIFQNVWLQIIEAYLAQFNPTDHTLKIDRLELNIGGFNSDNLMAQLESLGSQNLEAALKEFIEERILPSLPLHELKHISKDDKQLELLQLRSPKSLPQDAKPIFISNEQKEQLVLIYFLLNGYFPSWQIQALNTSEIKSLLEKYLKKSEIEDINDVEQYMGRKFDFLAQLNEVLKTKPARSRFVSFLEQKTIHELPQIITEAHLNTLQKEGLIPPLSAATSFDPLSTQIVTKVDSSKDSFTNKTTNRASLESLKASSDTNKNKGSEVNANDKENTINEPASIPMPNKTEDDSFTLAVKTKDYLVQFLLSPEVPWWASQQEIDQLEEQLAQLVVHQKGYFLQLMKQMAPLLLNQIKSSPKEAFYHPFKSFSTQLQKLVADLLVSVSETDLSLGFSNEEVQEEQKNDQIIFVWFESQTRTEDSSLMISIDPVKASKFSSVEENLKKAAENIVSIINEQVNFPEVLAYFLKYESLPLIQQKGGRHFLSQATFESILISWYEERFEKINPLFESLSVEQIFLHKGLNALSRKVVTIIVQKHQPSRASLLIGWYEFIEQMLPTVKQRVNVPDAFWKKGLLAFSIKYPGSDYSLHQFLKFFTKYYFRIYRKDIILLLESLNDAFEAQKDKLVLQQQREWAATLKLMIASVDPLSRKRTSLRPSIRQQVESTQRTYFRKEMENKYYINNAGVVIAWPFLSILFQRLKLLNSEKKFINEAAQMKAVHLIQYLAIKDAPYTEADLVLNKILCGMAINAFVDISITLDEDEKKLAESLLTAITQQWDKLKNTSTDGLRGSFFVRDGQLSLTQSGKWKLFIEKKPYDVLLDFMPWGLSTIKLKWMEKVLLVEWN